MKFHSPYPDVMIPVQPFSDYVFEHIFEWADAAAFIDPFTGSGMLMAVQSSAILADSITTNATPAAIAASYSPAYRRHFTNRLRVCWALRQIAFMPRLATGVVWTLRMSSSSRRYLARMTRR